MTQEKIDGLWLMMHPNRWTANTEIDFGGGLYGFRATGNITQAARTRNMTDISIPGIDKIVDCGGWFFGDTTFTSYPINSGYIETDLHFSVNSALTRYTNNVRFLSYTDSDRTNAPYDIWVKYTKLS